MRDGVEAFSSFLEDVRDICAAWHALLHADEQLSLKQWHEQVQAPSKKFHRLGLPDKFERLRKVFNFAFPGECEFIALSINAARNCLVHRKGVVSEGDANSPNGLRVRWFRPTLFVSGPDGERTLQVPGGIVDKGESLSLRPDETTECEFALGETVVFDLVQFSQLAWTLYMIAAKTHKALIEHAQCMGIRVTVTDSKQQNQSASRSPDCPENGNTKSP